MKNSKKIFIVMWLVGFVFVLDYFGLVDDGIEIGFRYVVFFMLFCSAFVVKSIEDLKGEKDV